MQETRQTRVRYLIVVMLFVVSSFSYGDRAVLSVVGVALSKQLHMDAVKLGWMLSAFLWACVVAQLPAGGLLDRFGSRRVYSCSIIGWAACSILTGFVGYLPIALAFGALFFLRMLASCFCRSCGAFRSVYREAFATILTVFDQSDFLRECMLALYCG